MACLRNFLLHMSHINLSLTTVTLVLLVCHSHTQLPPQLLPSKCWFSAPTVQEETINVQVVTQNNTASSPNGATMWNVSATLTWSRPTDLKKGGVYVVKLNQIPSFSEPSFCEIGTDETIVSRGEEHTFNNLEFGFLYEFTIYVYNITKGSKALMGTTRAFGTPDCFQATGDRRFCSGEDGDVAFPLALQVKQHAEIEFAGAPIEPILNHLCQNDTWARATISWLPPIQFNGNITSYGVQHAILGPRGLIMSETAYITPDKNKGPDGRIYYTISDLEPGLAYLIEITPYVTTSSDGQTNVGLAVEMTFIADVWQGPDTTSAGFIASSVAGDTLPPCPPDIVTTETITTTMTTRVTTQSPKHIITEMKQPAPTIIDESRLGHEEIAVRTSPSPQKPITVTVKVLVKEQNSNKAIAVVVSLLLCAILLAIVWLGVKVVKNRAPSAKKSTSVVVTDTGNKTTEKAEAGEKV